MIVIIVGTADSHAPETGFEPRTELRTALRPAARVRARRASPPPSDRKGARIRPACRRAGMAETQHLGPRFGAGFVRFRVGVPETSRIGVDETRAGVFETGRRASPFGSVPLAWALALSATRARNRAWIRRRTPTGQTARAA